MRHALPALALLGCVSAEAPLLPDSWGVSGCGELVAQQRCRLARGRDVLTVWVDSDAVEVTLDGQPVVVERMADDVGVQAKVAVEGPGTLEIRVLDEVSRSHRLELVPAGDADPVTEGEERADHSGVDRAHALSRQARQQLSERGLGVSAWLDEAVPLYLADGRITEAYRDASMAAWLAGDAGDFEDQVRRVSELPLPRYELRQRARWHNDHLYARLRTHDARGALRHADTAARWALRAGDPRTTELVRSYRARVLERLGRHEEALRLRADALEDVEGCDAAWALNSFGWSLVLAAEAGVQLDDPARWPHDGDIERVHLASVRVARAEGCHRPDTFAANAAVNRALGALHRGEQTIARRALDEVDTYEGELSEEVVRWRLLAEGRWALLDGDAQRAGAIAAELADETAQAGAWDLSLRARHLQGLALEATGDRAGAARILEQAQRAVASHGRLMPTWLGKDGFLSAWHQIAVDHARVLHAAGRDAEAVDAWRRYRAGFLEGLGLLSQRAGARASYESTLLRYESLSAELNAAHRLSRRGPLDQRKAQSLRAAELRRQILGLLDELNTLAPPAGLSEGRTPAPGEVLVGWIPVPGRPLGFVVSSSETHVAAVRPWHGLEGDALAEAVLSPLAPWLKGAGQITLLPVGELQVRDLHAVVLQGRLLADWAPVAYGLDLPSGPTTAHRRAAVVVADPTSDLAAARREATDVVARLQGRGVPTTLLQGDAASARDVRVALAEGPDLLHYAGHGTWSEEALDGGLELAGATRLTLADLVTLPAPPRVALLNGCETARSHTSPVASLGLAQGLLTSGTEAVIAADRTVDDTLAHAVAVALHEADLASGDVWQAWSTAIARVRHAHPNADWAAFRLLVR